MAKKKATATTKVMVYMPNPLYHQLRKAMFKMVRNNRSRFICEALEKALGEQANG